MNSEMAFRWFSQNKKEKKVFWEFDSIVMQNTSHNLLLFSAPTWPSCHVVENF